MTRHMSKSALALVASLAMVLTACSSATDGGPDDEAIILGVHYAATGPSSPYSLPGVAGIEIAVEEINAEGGINGRPLKIVSASDDSVPTNAPTVASRLISQGAAAILEISGSASGIAIKPTCQQQKIVCWAPSSVNLATLEAPNSDYMFISGPTTNEAGQLLANAMKAADWEKVGVIRDDSSSLDGYFDLLVEYVESQGMEVVTVEQVPAAATDVNAQVARVADQAPDGIWVTMINGPVESLIHSTVRRNTDIPTMSLFIGNMPKAWPLAADGALEGVNFPSLLDMEGNPRTAALADKLAAHSSDVPMDGFVAQAYDATHVLAIALQEVAEDKGDIDGEALRAAMLKIQGFETSYGSPKLTHSFSEDKHIAIDNECGYVLAKFGPDNAPAGLEDFQLEGCY